VPVIDDKITSLEARIDKRNERLVELLFTDDGLVALVLRAHLVAEELLLTAVAAYCESPERLKEARLRFTQLIPLFRALDKVPTMKDQDWKALEELNALRNALAHKIEPQDVFARVEKIVRMMLPSKMLKGLRHPLNSKESLKSAIEFFFGRLSEIAVLSSVFEAISRQMRQFDKKAP
jgi:hypothetical protein